MSVAASVVTRGRERGKLVPACRCEIVQRGPNWLFLRVEMTGEPCGLGDRLWRVAQGQFVYRLMVEFDGDVPADPKLGRELGLLCDRLTAKGGALRLCGLSPEAARVVLGESGCPRLHNHATRHDAVWCGPCRDGQPCGDLACPEQVRSEKAAIETPVARAR